MLRKKTCTFNLTFLKPHLPLIICIFIFLFGILLGCLIAGNIEVVKDSFTSNLNSFITVRNSRGVTSILFDSFKNVFPLYLLVFLVGTSVVGCALAPVIVMYNGFSYGCLAGLLYSTFKLEGIMFNALVCIPSALFSAFGLCVLLKNAVSFSYLLSGICIKANKPINIYSHFKDYCIQGVIILTIGVIAIFFDVAMSLLFVGFFNFKL